MLTSISNTFISNARLKLATNQANTKQHAEPELLSYEDFHIIDPRYHPKSKRTYSKK